MVHKSHTALGPPAAFLKKDCKPLAERNSRWKRRRMLKVRMRGKSTQAGRGHLGCPKGPPSRAWEGSRRQREGKKIPAGERKMRALG